MRFPKKNKPNFLNCDIEDGREYDAKRRRLVFTMRPAELKRLFQAQQNSPTLQRTDGFLRSDVRFDAESKFPLLGEANNSLKVSRIFYEYIFLIPSCLKNHTVIKLKPAHIHLCVSSINRNLETRVLRDKTPKWKDKTPRYHHEKIIRLSRRDMEARPPDHRPIWSDRPGISR